MLAEFKTAKISVNGWKDSTVKRERLFSEGGERFKIWQNSEINEGSLLPPESLLFSPFFSLSFFCWHREHWHSVSQAVTYSPYANLAHVYELLTCTQWILQVVCLRMCMNWARGYGVQNIPWRLRALFCCCHGNQGGVKERGEWSESSA